MSLQFLNITINFENNGDFLNYEQQRWNYLVENKGEKILSIRAYSQALPFIKN